VDKLKTFFKASDMVLTTVNGAPMPQ